MMAVCVCVCVCKTSLKGLQRGMTVFAVRVNSSCSSSGLMAYLFSLPDPISVFAQEVSIAVV